MRPTSGSDTARLESSLAAVWFWIGTHAEYDQFL
jgi:hypothetical protein